MSINERGLCNKMLQSKPAFEKSLSTVSPRTYHFTFAIKSFEYFNPQTGWHTYNERKFSCNTVYMYQTVMCMNIRTMKMKMINHINRPPPHHQRHCPQAILKICIRYFTIIFPVLYKCLIHETFKPEAWINLTAWNLQ